MTALYRFMGLCALALTVLAMPAAAQTAGMNKQQIEEIVRQYLLDNPEIIAEAIERLREKERIARAAAERQARLQYAAQLYNDPLTPELGDPQGDVTVVEFFDYQCGYCKRVFPTFMKVLNGDKKIRVLWKELPILGPVSQFAARAAMAAEKQGKYFEMHVALMEVRGRLSEAKVMAAARGIGLDIEKLADDMNDPEIAAYLQRTLEMAQALGINGTPAFLFGEQLVPGAMDENRMRQLIAAARNPKS